MTNDWLSNKTFYTEENVFNLLEKCVRIVYLTVYNRNSVKIDKYYVKNVIFGQFLKIS